MTTAREQIDALMRRTYTPAEQQAIAESRRQSRETRRVPRGFPAALEPTIVRLRVGLGVVGHAALVREDGYVGVPNGGIASESEPMERALVMRILAAEGDNVLAEIGPRLPLRGFSSYDIQG